MVPFFMSLVSPSDHWLFVASNGGITAGRVNAESSLFPYYTDDKIIDGAEYTGSKTIVRVQENDRTLLWEPFSAYGKGMYSVDSNLYKNTHGNRLRFEEVNHDLQLRFAYEWSFSDRFGILRQAWIENLGEDHRSVELLDGIQNILPAGIGSALQNGRSTLVDAYKKSELLDKGLAVYSLSARIIDRAEPSEALVANTVWSVGLGVKNYLLSNHQLDAFRNGLDVQEESHNNGYKGAYFAHADCSLGAHQAKTWFLVSELNQSTAQVMDLQAQLNRNTEAELQELLQNERDLDQERLRAIVAKGDGLQCTQLETVTTRHYGNVLFNVMRGGLFESAYQVDREDFRHYVNQVSTRTGMKWDDLLRSWPDEIHYDDLLSEVKRCEDPELERITLEYLPLSFSRRHGDPSRPWNIFNIHTRGENGKRLLSYEGNWRDIFQNWEALAYAYPRFVQGMISKFLNASTIDGYNPYRISKSGIDWEIIEEDDPWAYIGYWGDHQIIYLQKLLEHWERHESTAISSEWNRPLYTYANVPYRIRSFQSILENPKDTIDFDATLDSHIKSEVEHLGSDARMIWKDNQLIKATLGEKLLLTALTKMYNLVPDGGIWMNTQRPEWNDANNALVGNGMSMVTLYYLRRYLNFLREKWVDVDLELNEAIRELLTSIVGQLEEHKSYLTIGFDPRTRYEFVHGLGQAGERYRIKAYGSELGARTSVSSAEVLGFLNLGLAYLDASIASNVREDGLYHAYNLMQLKGDQINLRYLYEMLEGQVAILSAGYLKPEQSLDLLNALEKSALFREDQYSYLLYPNRELADFEVKNNISEEFSRSSILLKSLAEEEGNGIVERDGNGVFHFASEISNASDLEEALRSLEHGPFAHDAEKERTKIVDEFERIFDHQSFTGRSGTFYAYEGLGSIYWHMVSKLLLAVNETLVLAHKENSDSEVLGKLIDHYYSVRAGIGLNKGPQLYGAFPFDPYSHTPWNQGAKQPGMTGQVKEDILNRWSELGLQVENGELVLDPFFFDKKELLEVPVEFQYYDHLGVPQVVELAPGELAYTYNGLLIRYSKADQARLELIDLDDQVKVMPEMRVSNDHCRGIWSRKHNYKELRLSYSF
ncbi:hypothetical protein HZ996_02245 [Cryomorphaceae bacterium]|nr:hypothetical protein HZ996_02245 [Cryomorphaceae bacterium]